MRTAVTTIVILLALLVVLAVFRGSRPPQAQAPAAPVASTTPPAPATPAPPTSVAAIPQPPAAFAPAPASAPATESATTLPALSAQEVLVADESILGSNDPKSGYALEAKFSGWGASIEGISLTRYGQSADVNSPRYAVQSPVPAAGGGYYYPFAAHSVTINGQRVDLTAKDDTEASKRISRWKLVGPGQYEKIIVTPTGQPVLRIRRTYSLDKGPDAYEVLSRQTFENLGQTPLTVTWEQAAFADPPADYDSYIGDRRTFVAGYYNPAYDPMRTVVLTDNASTALATVIKSADPQHAIWPPKGQAGLDLLWLAEVNQYFAIAVHMPVPPSAQGAGGSQTLPQLTQAYSGVGADIVSIDLPALAPANADSRAVIQTLTSKPLRLEPGGQAQLDLAIFAGPRDPRLFDQQPYKALRFGELVRYELGCAFCTFQPLARVLLACLRVFHYVVRDWGLSIILLVLVIRVLLHPITRKSQISMAKMGKQMSTLQPELEKLKKKYADDQTTLNTEMMRLYKEKGVNPANMLGCLPMLLQTPIWIALYAMLVYAIELRHQPAFFGVFQWVSGGHWKFLADLSSQDNFIRFAHPITLPFINRSYDSINLLPMLMVVFYYFQQQYMMPPPASEQAAQQQKIGKWMTLIIPLIFYSYPSGLTLYMLASSIGGMVDGYIVRKHIKEQEENGTLFKKSPPKPRKPGGMMDRIQKFAEQTQRQMLEAQNKPKPKNRR